MADKEEKTTKVDPIGSKTYLTDLDVRIWLRDNDPEANKLLDDYEFSPEEIRTAMTLTVDHWNDQPPYIRSYDYDKFPYRSKLLQGTAANLLFMGSDIVLRVSNSIINLMAIRCQVTLSKGRRSD